MREFTRQTGLKRQGVREQVVFGDRDLTLAKQGKLFEFKSSKDDRVFSKPIDLSERYKKNQLRAENITFMNREKEHVWWNHVKDREWLSKNQELVLQAIANPRYADVEPRIIDRIGYNIAQIVETGDPILPYLNVVINFRNKKAKLWTIFRAGKEYLYSDDGILLPRWRSLK